jgi:hypothetical protein
LHERYFLSGDRALAENGSAAGGWAQPEPNRRRPTKILHLQRILPMKVPWPGVEPGLRSSVNHDDFPPKNTNVIGLFGNRLLLQVRPFYPDLRHGLANLSQTVIDANDQPMCSLLSSPDQATSTAESLALLIDFGWKM